MTTVTYSSAATISWWEPCWCCGHLVQIADCDAEAGDYELVGYCEPCENYHVAEAIRHLWDADGKPAGITSLGEPFNPETSYRACEKHGKREGREPR